MYWIFSPLWKDICPKEESSCIQGNKVENVPKVRAESQWMPYQNLNAKRALVIR